MRKSQVPSLRLPKPSVTFLRPWKLTLLFILNVLLERIRHGGRQRKYACSFCFLSPTTPPAPSRHHFRKPCPVTRNQGVSVWGILRPFSFVLSFYFLSSSKKQTGVSQSTLFPVQSVRNEAKKPGGLHTRPGLGGLGVNCWTAANLYGCELMHCQGLPTPLPHLSQPYLDIY